MVFFEKDVTSIQIREPTEALRDESLVERLRANQGRTHFQRKQGVAYLVRCAFFVVVRIRWSGMEMCGVVVWFRTIA